MSARSRCQCSYDHRLKELVRTSGDPPLAIDLGILASYRLPGYSWTALVLVAVSAAFVINTLIESPRSSLLGLVLVLAGIPVYWGRTLATNPKTRP